MTKHVSMRVTGAVALVAVSLGVSVALGAHSKSKADSSMSLSPANFAALSSNANVTSVPSGGAAPAIGVAARGVGHTLSHGATAWVQDGEVCWATAASSGCIPNGGGGQLAFDPVISDPDQAGSGLPARVAGVAVDGVKRVEATLEDGTSVSAAPSNNWYEIDLPKNELPWSVSKVEAFLSNGETVTVNVPTTAPAISH